MPTLYVRDFPDELHRKLRQRAEREHRSIGAEVTKIVEEALEREDLREQRLQALRSISRLRATLKPSSGPSSLDDIREDRSR